MTVDQQKEVDLFIAALELPTPEERRAYVRGASEGDDELYQRFLLLMESHDQSQGPLDIAPMAIDATRAIHQANEDVGQQIGPYKLLEVIGEGGMGTVYMAEQTEPVHRRVALKLIKTGMDTRQVIARFEAERQALALMDHPNISKVHDAGSTAAGHPYFVMELVKGKPITRFCDEQKLDTETRLKLFQQVCHAVQHAHQKGIIHRDIKPSNVLVAMYDDRPVPKVIDFGVAKATGEQLTEKTMFTRFGQIVGTLEYMSPEQAQFNQLDIDTRSDIYSLGALLCELLTGEPPFEREKIKNQALDETLRMIREDEPTKPSTKLSATVEPAQIASNRHTTFDSLSSTVRGDLDWIVMKSLEKDRNRRYESARALSDDVQRYLANEPVLAMPPSTKYRVQKFVQRNRRTVMAASAAAIALIFGIVGIAFGIVWAVSERNQSERRLTQVVKGNEILTSIFKDLDLDEIKQGPDPLETVLATRLIEAGKQLDGESIGEPLIVATLQHQLGESLTWVDKKAASDLYKKSWTTRSEILGPDHPDTLESMVSLGGNYLGRSYDNNQKALPLLQKAMVLTKENLGVDHEVTRNCMNYLAQFYHIMGQSDKALPLIEKVLELAVKDNDREKTCLYMHNIAYLYLQAGQPDKAIPMFEEALAIQTDIGAGPAEW